MVSSTGLLSFLVLSLAGSVAGRTCKTIPGSRDWPSPATWQKFNQTLNGRLIDPTPPAAVCHSDRKEYNPAACEEVTTNWVGGFLHTNDPVSSYWNQWSNDTCLPVADAPCSDDGYPTFVVNATTAEHIKHALKFAKRHNIRLIVKNTGHDYLGRSSGGFSLSIWTHHLSQVSFETGSWQPKGCNKKSCTQKQPRAILGAGAQFGNVYAYLDKFNHTIVGGTGMTVGMGGFLTGGGHGILSGSHGLGADNVLEVEMVTPSGDLITLNECQNTDLFWAVRGGGGSTFGIITKFVVRAFPTPKLTSSLFQISAAPNSTAALGLGPLMLSKISEMFDRDIAGYIWTTANGADLVNPGGSMGGAWGILVLEGDNVAGVFDEIYNPILAEAKKRWGDAVSFLSLPAVYPSLLAYMSDNKAAFPSGINKFMDTRLISADKLTNEPPELIEATTCAGTRSFYESLSVLLVNGKGLWNAKPRGGGNAVHPSWRNTAALLSVDGTFEPLSASARQGAINSVNKCMAPLRKLEPSTGAYVNEAIRYQENWQRVFFGSHYDRLLKIKRKVDPQDVLWCEACVGSERWEEVEGQLCKIN